MDRERLNQYAQPIVDIYNQLENDLLASMAKFLGQNRDLLDNDPEKWKLQQMQSLGMIDKTNLAIMKADHKLTNSKINKLLLQAGLEGLDQSEAFFKQATKKGARLINPDNDPDKDPTILKIIEAFVKQAKKVLNLTNSTMLDQAKQIYKDIVNKTTMDVANGFLTGDQALRQTIRQWANEGIPALIRSDGARLGPEGYVRTVIVSTTNNVVNTTQDTRMDQWGVDLVEVTSHIGARPKCAPYQGRIFSRSGKDKKYPPLASTSMGQPDGLFGINCGHSKYPFIEGVSDQRYFPYPDGENKKVYDESQRQREIERTIRKFKRQEIMFRESGDNEAADKAKQMVKLKQKQMREFIKDTGRTRRSGREQIETGTEKPTDFKTPDTPKTPKPDPDKKEPDKPKDNTPPQVSVDQKKQISSLNQDTRLKLAMIGDPPRMIKLLKRMNAGEFDEAPLIVKNHKGKWDAFETERDKDGNFKYKGKDVPDDTTELDQLNGKEPATKEPDKPKKNKPDPPVNNKPKKQKVNKKPKDSTKQAIENFKSYLPTKEKLDAIINAKDQWGNTQGRMAEQQRMKAIKEAANDLLKGSGIKVSLEDADDANGYCEFRIIGNKLDVSRYVLHAYDKRDGAHRIKTMFHEFYHSRAKGLDPSQFRNDQRMWTDWEETLTEAAAHKMLREAGIEEEITFAYAEKLTRNLPKLKTHPEFAHCNTIEDFGEVAMKYRFNEDEMTMDWTKFKKHAVLSSHIADWELYVRKHYKKYAMDNKDELVDLLMKANPGAPRKAIEESFTEGWKYYRDVGGPGFTQSLATIMNRIGVKKP